MDAKKTYTRVLQWRRPSFILTIPPALVLRLGLETGQDIVLDEYGGMLIGVPSKARIAKKDLKSAERYAKKSATPDYEPEGGYDPDPDDPLDKLRL